MRTSKYGYIKTYSILWPIILALLSLIIIGLQIDCLRLDSEPRVYFPRFEHKTHARGQISPYKAILARITCYLPTGNPMSNGKMPREGFVATSDRTIPLGTKILIDGKEYEVGDRTARWVHHKKGNTVDIFKEDCSKAFGATIKQVIY